MRILMRAGKLWDQQFDPTYDYSANTFGSNSGNLAYQFSINRLLTSSSFSDDDNNIFVATKYRQNFSTEEINYINDHFDYFILPMANNLGRKNFISQLNEISSLIEKLKIPCVVVGIGVQTDIGGDLRALPGKEENKRFLRAILNKSKSIGVRGELTKNIS